MPDKIEFTDVERVELVQRRWSALIRVIHRDGSVEETLACAEGDHSGLWLGDPAEHEED